MSICRWYTASDDEDKGHGEHKDKGQRPSEEDNGGSVDHDDHDDLGEDNHDHDDGISDMDILHSLYNIANLLQLQGRLV